MTVVGLGDNLLVVLLVNLGHYRVLGWYLANHRRVA